MKFTSHLSNPNYAFLLEEAQIFFSSTFILYSKCHTLCNYYTLLQVIYRNNNGGIKKKY